MRDCGVYDLMVDIVEMWLRDYKLAAPEGAWNDLIDRLAKCDHDLKSRFQCSRVREYEEATA